MMVTPILSQGKATGVIVVINPVGQLFDSDALTVIQGMGGLAGTTIQNAQLYEQLQKAQERYLELFEESMDLVFVTDWDGRIIETNRQAVSMTGFPADRLHAMGIGQLHLVDWDKVGKGFVTLRKQGLAFYESALQTADGDPSRSRSTPAD